MMLTRNGFRSAARTKVTFAVTLFFLISLLISISGCGLFSSSDNPSSNSNDSEEKNPAELQALLDKANRDVERLSDDKKKLEKDKTDALSDFETSKQNCAKQKGKYEKGACDKTDAKEQILLAAEADFDAKEIQLGEAKGRVVNAKKRLESLKNNPPGPSPTGESSTRSSGGLLSALPKVLLVLAVLVIIALLVLIYLTLRSEISKANGMLDSALKRLDKQKLLSEESIKQIGALRETVSVIQTDVRNIGKSTPSGKRTNPNESSPSIGAKRRQEDLDESLKNDFGYPSSEPEPFFPISVEALIERLGHDSLVVESELATGNFVEDRAGHFLLITDPLPPHDFCIVPRLKKVQTQNEYFTHYSNYYTCQNPSGGEIVVLKPATVTRVDGGWKLKDKGELEIS